MDLSRKPYPSDVSDEEWALVAPYLALLPEDAGQREHSLREAFNGLRYVIRSGCPWRMLPNDLPPWAAVYQQAQRWLAAGCFEHLAHDLRAVLRMAAGREPEPTAAVLDSRTLRSTPESGQRAGYDGHKRKKGSKLHMAVDTLGHFIALSADKGYDADWLRADLRGKGITPVIPGKRGSKRRIRLDKSRYRVRWRIEAMFNRLKDFRRIATRYDKLARNYASALALAAVVAFWC